MLGSVEAARPDGSEVTLGERQRALLACLLARAGQVVPADTLADLLWGPQQPSDPAAALQSQVSRLRRALAPVAIHTRPPGYVLQAGPDDVDALRFEQLVAEARTADPVTAERLLSNALAMWRGGPYAEFAETPVARFAAIRLAEARLAAIEAWHRAMLACGRAAESLPALEAFVSEHPLREQGRELLMRTLYALGRHADALNVYSDYERRLADELGLEPAAAIQDLRLAILRHELEPAAEGVAVASRSSNGGSASEGPPSLAGLEARFVAGPTGHPIAVASLGSGPAVVAIPGWVSSIDVIASGRDLRSSLLQRLVGSLRLTIYDRLGTGLSVGSVEDYGLDASVAELEAVVRQCGGRTSLLAMSQAGPVVVRFAARHPELVERLVFFGTYANGPQTFVRPDLNAALIAMVRSHWGMAAKLFADLYRPNATPDAGAHLGRVLVESASSEVAAGYLAAVYDVDVSPDLPMVTAPALVMHYRGDRLVPFAGGRQLAAGLPNARLLALDGSFHLPDVTDLDRIAGAITRFVGGDMQGHPLNV